MSHDYGWRGSGAAGGVTAVVVGSGALFGALALLLEHTRNFFGAELSVASHEASIPSISA